MKGGKRYICRIAAAVAAVILFLCNQGQVLAQEQDEEKIETRMAESRRVLFISSYSYTWSTVPLQMKGIQTSLADSVSLDVEFMDTKNLSPEIAEEELLERVKFKEEHAGGYDAVIVGDDAAFQFAMKYREELFPGIPVVFEGINNIEYAREMSQDPLVTGVIESFSYKENIEFALKIQPEAKHILAIVDDTVTGEGEQQQFYAQEKEYAQLDFDVINGSRLTEKEIISAISDV